MVNRFSRKALKVAAVAASGALLIGATCAMTWPSAYQLYNLHNRHTGYCLDSNAGGAVYTLPCNGGEFQNWNIWDAYSGPGGTETSGVYMLQDEATGRCLDSNSSGNIYTNPCQFGNRYQRWQLGGSAYYQSATLTDQATGRFLDGNYGQAYTLPPNGGNWQSWVIYDLTTGGCVGPNC